PIDFKALFDRLDPKPAPSEVSTDQLDIPGTVALWRPSGSGNVSTVQDLSGHGNDLTPQTLSGSTRAQSVRRIRDDHCGVQPSDPSFVFSSNKGPKRGTFLKTPDGAPLNTNEFKNGYTIEAYIKLPSGCCANNAWMGIMGQMGTGADLGRTSND